jgi:competence protein ComEC
MRFVVLAVALLAGCPSHPPRSSIPTGTLEPAPGEPRIKWTRVEAPADVPREPPAPGTYRIHLIDVGTGLSILVQGADFNLLYDAGTNDRDEKPSRILRYLAAAIGPSGDDLCGEEGPKRPIQRVVLSHPHFDHASAMDLVVHCYDVQDFYDSGRINDAKFYRALMDSLARSPATRYHTAASVPDDHLQDGARIEKWERFSEGDVVELGEGAKFTILHAEPKSVKDINENSVVIAVQLGGIRLLLVGDAPSGSRQDPSAPAGEVEQFLIDHHAAEIHADILQVGHHGSKTSSRRAFLQAVHPKLALVSSGPKVYGHTVLPDREVIDEIQRTGAKILRTDERDDNCPLRGRIGGDEGPGGCDSYIITIGK